MPLKRKKNQPHSTANEALSLSEEILNQINKNEAGHIIFNEEGKILAINEEAAALFSLSQAKLLNKILWNQALFKFYKGKRLLATAKKYFEIAKQGIPQQFNWLQTDKENKKPQLAYKIVLSQSLMNGKLVYFARIQNYLPYKLIEWALWSLAEIKQHEEISELIDEITQLMCVSFNADYAFIQLTLDHEASHLISCYPKAIQHKTEDCRVFDSPAEAVIKEKKICFYPEKVQNNFPKDKHLKALNVNAYLAGPIINVEDEVVGVVAIMSKKSIIKNPVTDVLFKLFIDRITLEIDKYLAENELQLLASIPQEDPNPVIRVKLNGELIYANEAGQVILNYWKKKQGGLPATIINDIVKMQMSKEVLHDEIEFQDKTYLLTFVGIENFNEINIYGTDITQLKNAEKDILKLARFDALTQTANRQYFEEILIKTLAIHHGEQQKLALLLIDIDNFKMVNDTLGHPIGDHLLKVASKRMHHCIRDNDFLGRLGGDEFIIILNKTDVDDASTVAKKINETINRPFMLGEYKLDISCSIGIAIYPDSAITASNLLKHADIAMYQAKKKGKNRYEIFSNQIDGLDHKRQNLIKKDLSKATSKNQLYITYQPYFNLMTQELAGYESFLRWKHPEIGLIFPIEFIPLAEQTGSIKTIGQWGIEQSLEDFSEKLNKTSTSMLTLNISVIQMNDARFLDTLIDALKQFHLHKEQIILDISEHIMEKGIDAIKEELMMLDQSGIKLSLDNFGSPQISLTKLSRLPISYLKLDQNLLINIETDHKARMLLKGIFELADNLNLTVIQKGVETPEQDEILKSLNCPFAQGHFYCPPVKIEELSKLIFNFKPKSSK